MSRIVGQGNASTGQSNGARAFFWLCPILWIAYVRFCACLYRFPLLCVGKNTAVGLSYCTLFLLTSWKQNGNSLFARFSLSSRGALANHTSAAAW